MGNREKLLETACSTFGAKGYKGTSLDDLLKAAGVCPSNFYYHFASKEELASEVLQLTIDRVRSSLTPIFEDPEASAARKLERIHAEFVCKMSANDCCGGCPLGNLATELSDSHPDFRRRLAEFFVECRQGIEAVVRQGMRDGEFRKDLDPRAAAWLLFGSIEGLMLLSRSLKELDPLEQGFRQAVKLLKSG